MPVSDRGSRHRYRFVRVMCCVSLEVSCVFMFCDFPGVITTLIDILVSAGEMLQRFLRNARPLACSHERTAEWFS